MKIFNLNTNLRQQLMKYSFFILLLLCTSCKTVKETTTTYSKADNLAEFNAFITDFEKNYIYLNDKRDICDCIKKQYPKKVEMVTNVVEHIRVYEILLTELYDSHIHLNTNTSESYRLNAPIYIINKNGKAYIKNVWQTQLNSPLEKNIIGAEIMTINDKKFQDAIDDFPTICHNKQDEKVREWVANKVIAGKRNEKRILTLKLKSGEAYVLDMDQLSLRNEKDALTASVIPSHNIGLIRINNTLGDSRLVDEFEQALSTMTATKAVIIDLRNTVDGGNTGVAEPIMGMFVDKKQSYQLYENSKKKYLGYLQPYKNFYKNKVYLLVNRWTGSMGEGFAIGLEANGAIVIGTEMERLAGGMKTISFKQHNYGFNVSFEKIFNVQGEPRELFIPKDYVNQTQTNKDEILEYAIQKIKAAKTGH